MSDYSELLAKMQEYLEWSDDVIADGATSETMDLISDAKTAIQVLKAERDAALATVREVVRTFGPILQDCASEFGEKPIGQDELDCHLAAGGFVTYQHYTVARGVYEKAKESAE